MMLDSPTVAAVLLSVSALTEKPKPVIAEGAASALPPVTAAGAFIAK